jgi:hypothetical protein
MVTVPMGTGPVAAVTLTVKVTLLPSVEGLADEVSVVVS